MNPDKPSSSPRTYKYTPKPPRTRPTPIKCQSQQTDEETNQDLLRRATEQLGRRGPKAEKKSRVQVAFGHGAAASTSIMKDGIPMKGDTDKSNGSDLNGPSSDDEQILSSPLSTAEPGRPSESYLNAKGASSQEKKRQNITDWDYHNQICPISLPMTRFDSGDPEYDEEEFGKSAMNPKYDENRINAAKELGLLEENEEKRMFLVKFPSILPSIKESTADDKKADGQPNLAGSLEDLPGGSMGKLLVYKSGAIKWKLGNVLFDVSPGSKTDSAESAAAINIDDKDFSLLGEIDKHAIVAPDTDHLLKSTRNPQ